MTDTCTCPRCGGEAYRESVDVGVGTLYGPFGCSECGWSECSEYDLLEEGGLQEDGSYLTPQGVSYPKDNPVAQAIRRYEEPK